MVDQVPINSPYETFSDVAKELFSDGIYNWGRIVILFYFTYKLILKVRERSFFFILCSCFYSIISHYKINHHQFYMYLLNGLYDLLKKLLLHGLYKKVDGYVFNVFILFIVFFLSLYI